MKNLLRISFINFIVFIISIVLLELIFGNWFKKDFYGYYVEDFKNIKIDMSVKHGTKKYNYIFSRDKYGFIGNTKKISEIDAIFLGGSTGVEIYNPPKFRIVELLNEKFKKDKIQLYIANASTDGKTLRGYAYDLERWLPKIQDLKHKYIIFYVGINDLGFDAYYYDYKFLHQSNFLDFINERSFLVNGFKKINNNFFRIGKKVEAYNLKYNNLYDNHNYTNFDNAKKKYDINSLILNNTKLVKQFKFRLNNLKIIMQKSEVVPIFITQIRFDGMTEPNLYLLNQLLKEFCKKNNYNIIKIDELINYMPKDTFYDYLHTTPKGSSIIANSIYEELKKIIQKDKKN